MECKVKSHKVGLKKKRKKQSLSTQPVEFLDGYSLVLFDEIQSKADEWTDIVPDNIFFSIPFLELVEHTPPHGIKPFYAILYKDGGLAVGVLSLQMKEVDLSESMNFDEGFKKQNAFQKLSVSTRKTAAKLATFNTLICGNVLLTGEYGFHFSDKTILYKDQFNIVEMALNAIAKQLKKHGYKSGPILMKDYYKDKEFALNNLNESKFCEFAVQPNMILNIQEDWKSFDDYLKAIKSKYRVRAKRAFKKLGPEVTKRHLTPEDIIQYQQRLFDLYIETASEADFNLFTLPVNYFRLLTEYLGDKIKIVGYFMDGEMIGYYTILFNTEYMEAHYLGYDKSKNGQRQIYLNMLFDLVKEGIDHQVNKIQFARTALEIKSSIGAIPYDMLCYLKHQSGWKNAMLPRLLKVMVPVKEWKPRTPFK